MDPAPATASRTTPSATARAALAVAVLGGPLAGVVGGFLAPSIHADGATSIAAATAADPATNGLHLLLFTVAGYLLPVSAVGLARLAYAATPRLAVAGGIVGVLGWLPWQALTAQDDLAAVLARTPVADGAAIYDRFGATPVELSMLLVYVVGHLAGYVLLGSALLRARAVPAWAAWAFVMSSPLLVAGFVLPGRPLALGYAGIVLTVVASVPAAAATLRPGSGRA